MKDLSEAIGRSKSYLAIQALQSYVEQEAWQIETTHKAIAEANAEKFATSEQIKALHKKCGYSAD